MQFAYSCALDAHRRAFLHTRTTSRVCICADNVRKDVHALRWRVSYMTSGKKATVTVLIEMRIIYWVNVQRYTRMIRLNGGLCSFSSINTLPQLTLDFFISACKTEREREKSEISFPDISSFATKNSIYVTWRGYTYYCILVKHEIIFLKLFIW